MFIVLMPQRYRHWQELARPAVNSPAVADAGRVDWTCADASQSLRAVLAGRRYASAPTPGGDPDAVFLMGNSAGGRHVASYLYHEDSHFDDGPGVIGAMLSSSSFGVSDSEAHRVYYRDDAALRASLVPLGLVDSYDGPEIPVFLWSAEFDPANIEAPVAAMYAKLCGKYEDCPRFTQFQGHNHVSHIMSINSADDEVSRAVLEFIHSVTAR